MARAVIPKPFNEAILDGLMEWCEAHPGQQWDKDTVAEWMIDKGFWKQQRSSALRELGRLIVRAAKKKKVRNQQGKLVRAWHAARTDVRGKSGIIQRTFWQHRDSLTVDFANKSFHQRWDQAAGHCRSLHDDVEDFNSNNPNSNGHKIQLGFDFTAVVNTPTKQKVSEISASEIQSKKIEKESRNRRKRKDRKPR